MRHVSLRLLSYMTCSCYFGVICCTGHISVNVIGLISGGIGMKFFVGAGCGHVTLCYRPSKCAKHMNNDNRCLGPKETVFSCDRQSQ